MGEADLETDNTVGLGGLEACGSSEKPNLTVLEETRADFPGEKLGSVMSGRRKENNLESMSGCSGQLIKVLQTNI